MRTASLTLSFTGCCLVVGLMVVAPLARAGVIDLNTFVADPNVTIAADGISAVLREAPSPMVGAVLLVNDPGLGDPEVIVPATGALLRFDYTFTLDPTDRDEFSAFLIDALTGVSVGPPWEFAIDVGGSGTVGFALSGLLGRTLGLVFVLARLPGDGADSALVTISGLMISEAPLPMTWLLVLPGLVAVRWFSRKDRGHDRHVQGKRLSLGRIPDPRARLRP